ncbi:MAG: hypothetical protein S4CHLAM81_05550 [Chlamydiales bacterium]|nr:hypothetical protein [Chlamydiales bacterium]MCH9635340.1 hypothetical protein [Chlamydiales bacterium]MCH9703327.1 glycosyltransferase [Chlamydiota bacterium]
MSISVITPTEERPERLLNLYHQLRNQTLNSWQWLIYDCSLRPCKDLQLCKDPRVVYIHDMERKSIGKRRNLLIEKAEHSLIAHLDDDDIYSIDYLELVRSALSSADLFYIPSFFAYHEGSRQYFYWDSEVAAPRRMAINPIVGARIREMDFGKECKQEDVTGYGFTFAYRKDLAQTYSFLDCDLGEDRAFFSACKGRRIVAHPDRDGVVLKVIHDSNASVIHPQYMIPRFVMKLTHPHLVANESCTLSC